VTCGVHKVRRVQSHLVQVGGFRRVDGLGTISPRVGPVRPRPPGVGGCRVQPAGASEAAGRGPRSQASGQSSPTARKSSAVDTSRSSASRSASGASTSHRVVGAVGGAGDSAGVASEPCQEAVGGLPRAAQSRPTAAPRRVPRPDRPNGAGESELGLLPDPRRTLQGRLHSIGYRDPLGAPASSGSSVRAPVTAQAREWC
jgi:hypothetical protein